MGSSLVVYLAKKDDKQKGKDNMYCLLELSTTPARELIGNDLLKTTIDYTREDHGPIYKQLSIEKIHDVMNYYNTTIKSYEDYIKTSKDNIQKLEERLCKVSSVGVYREIEKEISTVQEDILEYKEELKRYKQYYDLWGYCVLTVYQTVLENKNEWDFLNDVPNADTHYELLYYLN